MALISLRPLTDESPPSRGAWIEIPRLLWMFWQIDVAPLAGGVD